MYKINPRKLIIYSFGIFVGMLVFLGIFWTQALHSNNKSLENIVNSQIKRQLLFTMRDAAHKRAISLMRMTSLTDPFDIDDEYIKFKEHAGNFISARDVLMAFYFTDKEKAAWEKTKPLIKKAEVFQRRAAEFIIDNEKSKAVQLLYEEIIPIQDVVNSMLTQFMDLTRDQLDMEIGGSLGHNKTIFNIISVLIGVVVVLGAMAAAYFIRRTSVYEVNMKKQNQRIRYLYELSSQSGITTNEQLDKMLSLGCHLLGAEIGKICKIDEEVGTNTIVRVHSPQYDIEPGHTIPLEYTFCRIAFGRDEPIAIDDVSHSEYKSYPCYEFSHLESYIATPIKVRGEKWGTVNFCSHYPAPQPFTDTDTDLVNLIGNWVGFMLEKQLSKSELQEAKTQAEKISTQKSEFFGAIGRELQNPARTISDHSKTVLGALERSDVGDLQNGLETIHSTSEYLMLLVYDVLDLSSIEEGKFELHYSNFTLGDVLDEFGNNTKKLLDISKNDLNINMDKREIILYTDVIRFKQLLFNIVNAISRLSNGGNINISANHYYAGTKGWLQLKISEYTSGLSEEYLAALLEPFWSDKNNYNLDVSKIDIGLIISSQLCQLMGGEITVKSLKDVGSTYTVNLPIVVAEGLGSVRHIAG